MAGKPSEFGASGGPLPSTKDGIAGHQGALNGPRTASPRFLLTCSQVFLELSLLLAGWGSLPTRTFPVRQVLVPVTPLSPGDGRAFRGWPRRKGRAARTERGGGAGKHRAAQCPGRPSKCRPTRRRSGAWSLVLPNECASPWAAGLAVGSSLPPDCAQQ